jgi:hypothetical protein
MHAQPGRRRAAPSEMRIVAMHPLAQLPDELTLTLRLVQGEQTANREPKA